MHSAEQLQLGKPIHFSQQNAAQCCGDSAYVCTALSAMQSLIVGFVAVMSLRANDLLLENEVPALSWELYMYILLRKLQAMSCCNVRLMYYPNSPNLNPSHTLKRL